MAGDGSVCVVAGELSGDQHASEWVAELRQRRPGLDVWGIGGDHLEAAGMTLHRHCRDMAVMGFWEVVKRYGFFRQIFDELLEEIRRRRPALVVLVDYPGFNLRLAKALSGSGIPVVQYVCPQVWAWKKGRIKTMAEVLDEVLCILPFEPDHFADTPLRATFIGHPLVASIRDFLATPEQSLPWQESELRIGLLPGSRATEVERLLPVMLHAAAELARQRPEAYFLVGASDPERAEQIAALVRQEPDVPNLAVVTGQAREIMRQSTAAWIASGTATLEAGLIGCPTVIVYRTAWLTYAIGKRVVTIDHVGLVNILSKREVCPELLQDEATPERLLEHLLPLLGDTPQRAAMQAGLDQLPEILGDITGPGPAADRLMTYLEASHD